ncbi:MAG: hypothetical protein M3R38_14090 [Actinomycetota bacterium]|nr:hypothetical protein [Actinomycetota bacterium]
MTESRQASGVEYAEEFIGECLVGSCDRPATVRVYEDFVLCALHHMMHEAGHDADEAGLALELLGGWRSVAAMHGNGYLLELFEFAKADLLERKATADRRQDQLERIDRENVGNTETRLEMGRRRLADKKPEQEEPKEEPKEQPADYPDVYAAVNGLLSEAAALLKRSHPPTNEEDEAAREALHALSAAGLIVSRLLRGRRRASLGPHADAGQEEEEAAEPESGADSEATCA